MAIRTGASYQLPVAGRVLGSGSQFALQSKVQFQDRNEDRMMLSIERNVAAPIRLTAGLGLIRTGAPAHVRDRRHRSKQYCAPELADGVAEIHVLRIEKEPLVEQPRGYGIRTANQQTCAAHPVDGMFPRRFCC